MRGAGWWGLAGGGLWLGLLSWVVVHGDSGPGVCVLFRSAAPALGRSSRRLPTPACLLTASPRLPAWRQVSDEISSGALFGCLKFSLDGSLLLAVAEGRIYLLDSFDGRLVQKVGRGGA